MLVTYIRSSSYNQYTYCQMSYFITYVLGYLSDSGKKAELGTMVHKVMESLAGFKKYQQDNPKKKTLEIDDDALGKIKVSKDEILTDSYVEILCQLSYDAYKKTSKHDWMPADLKQVKKLVFETLNYNKGQFDPRYRDVIDPEPHFDIPIEEDWAKFEYEINGEKIKGQLAIKGTIDLVTKVNDDTIEVIDWKGLPIETPIPTPEGWSTMGELKIGDLVFDKDGQITKVIGKSQIKNKPCYKISFDDKTEVVCDDEHLWALDNNDVVSIKDLKVKDKISVAKPMVLEEAILPIEPYTLGVWLGDGRNRSGEITKSDSFIFEEISRRGYTIGKDIGGENKCDTRTVFGLTTKLKELNLLHNKHIPLIYLRSSFNQRLDLLRGLMDSDGNVNNIRKQAVFTNCNKLLSDNVKELLLTLGQRPNQCKTKQKGFGLTVDCYPIHFRPININPFLLPRKADKILAWGNGISHRRLIKKIELITNQQTQCIMVDSPTSTYLCTKNMIPTHNTGRRLDWATGEEKDLEKLNNDAQLLLYNYAISKLYPQYKHVIMSIFFMKDGGPFSMCFDKADHDRFLDMLRSRYYEIQNNQTPRPINPQRNDFRCNKLCHFYKNNWPNTDKKMCIFIEDHVKKHGIEETVKQCTNPGFNIGYYESPG